VRLPDFIIAGAPRSGTTWLYAVLDRHPDVYMAKPRSPEPKFFLVDELYAQGLARYAEWFEPARPDQRAGEKSTNYLERAVVAERMAHDVPNVRLVFILREPAARAYSNYLWSCMNGMEDEDFATALAREDERERTLPPAMRYARPHAYFSRGLYAELLRPFFDRFPREHILVLRFEDVVGDASGVATTMQRFVGVSERGHDVDGLGIVNASVRGGESIPEDVRQALQRRYEEPNAQLAALLGDDFRPWGADER
jgi:hypothetical protein